MKLYVGRGIHRYLIDSTYLIPGYVHIEATPSVLAHHIVVTSGAFGKEGAMLVAMYAHVEHLGIGLEDVLSAVAMMNVPVNNQYALQAIFPYRILCGNGHIIEYAEAMRLIRFRMMTRRSDIANAAAGLATQHAVHRLEHGAGGERSTLEGARMQINRIVAGAHFLQFLSAASQQAAHRIDMGARMCQTNLIRGGGPSRQLLHSAQ